MINTFSYFRIFSAMTVRGFGFGAGLGALYGTLIFPVIGTAFGLFFGGIVGLFVGLANGLFMACIVWVCRPNYEADKLIQFCTFGCGLLSLAGGIIGFSLLWGGISPFITIIPSMIAGLSCAWAARRVASKVALADLYEKPKRKRHEMEEDLFLPETA